MHCCLHTRTSRYLGNINIILCHYQFFCKEKKGKSSEETTLYSQYIFGYMFRIEHNLSSGFYNNK